jgi:magnesium chelatase family protein
MSDARSLILTTLSFQRLNIRSDVFSEPARFVVIASISSSTLLGVDGQPVVVEVHVASGLPLFAIVGLADLACREARDRVRAAVISSGLNWPLKRITVNLAPADIKKLGSALDLAIAIGVLVANGDMRADLVVGLAFLGELGLDGSIRRVPGVVPLVDAVVAPQVVVPMANADEAAFVRKVQVRCAPNLRSLIEIVHGREPWALAPRTIGRPHHVPSLDLADVKGQPFARRALEVAATGGHHLLMCGSPGSGKTMLAQRITGILPLLSEEQALEMLRIRSAAGVNLGLTGGGLDAHPPFRAPHHATSMVALVGGGSQAMRPGELSLAHHGVLFLDELSEFAPTVLDALRQPLEEGVVRVARARASIEYPARFQLVAATNPCPCGWRTAQINWVPQGEGSSGLDESPGPACTCGDAALVRMARRLSGPLLDRIDVRVDVRRPNVDELLGGHSESTAAVAQRVHEARQYSLERGVRCNADLGPDDLHRWAVFDEVSTRHVERMLRLGHLTARGMDRLRRVARTVADLSGRPIDAPLDMECVSEAAELRRMTPAEVVPA